MYKSRIAWLTLTTGFASIVRSQQSGWQQNQVNATMCTWAAPRAAQLKDTVYMDGGYLFWVPGMADGSYGLPTQDNNPLGLIYTLNFSVPFNSSTNVSSIFQTISKAPNGGAANNFGPNYYDGAMLANDDEFFLYGGLLTKTDAYSPPDEDQVLAYQVSQYGPEKANFHPGFLNDRLPVNTTRYVTYGGAANAPSEEKAWYFGGYRSPSWGPIYYPQGNASFNPTNVSNTLITLDMTTQQQEVWLNSTLPEGVSSRANPSVVWVPVGEQGLLVVLGGVTFPNYNNPSLTSQDEAQSKQDSPIYMEDIDVYDIAGDKWYKQPSSGPPPQLALGCAVVAPAQDFSSYNIYYYGGYDGINQDQDFNDDVYILSLPSFMWMKVSSGTPGHARAGHQCVTPYPDQMVTIGGFTASKGASINCLENGILDIFNLTSASWQDSYDPDSWNEYGVPEMIHMMIGGDYSGGATMTTPDASGWATPALASVFATTYPASKLTTYYPYSSQGPGNSTRGTSGGGGGGGTPSWVAPVLGVILGLVFVTAIVVGIMLYRRRKMLRKGGNSENPTDDNRNRIASWLKGQGTSDKATTVTSDEPSRIPDTDMESRGTPFHSSTQPTPAPQPEMGYAPQEMAADTAIVELMDTSPRVELADSGLTPVDVIAKHTKFGSNPSTNPSSFFTDSIRDHASSISSSHIPQPPPVATSGFRQQRPDSPSLGSSRSPPPPGSSTMSGTGSPTVQGGSTPSRSGIVSGVSNLSERETSHLRNISNATVSSATGTAASPPGTPPPNYTGFAAHPHQPYPYQQPSIAGQVSPPLPVSPPSVGVASAGEASDYVSVHSPGRSLTNGSSGSGSGSVNGSSGTATASPFRRSVFRESTDDLGETRGPR
ncbi:hypothetical protein F5Y15DRAFT_382727 [Xylariaceae sp. FL0016]|nr:hypothetical protein F5Y15DRAFT_382727 [Xylariaceae sp. FL0016]